MKRRYASLEEGLKRHFGYSSFRTGQKEIIEDIMNGKDVLGILPTGSGKSICYQLPAKLSEGLTIVVSPLISLMIDQVKQLKAANFKGVIALNSFMEPMERKRVYQNLDTYQLIYTSPELLQKKELQDRLKQIDISLFVIDEAHCISQWGHEFRPDYLKLNTIIKRLGNPAILALSATASPDVQDDISRALERPNITKHIYPMDRNNIAFCVQEVSDDHEKLSILQQLLSTYHVPVLIYFTSRIAAENTALQLTERLPSKRVAFYHGGMEQMDRITIQQQFMIDQLDVVCCTSAFGMGINKSNIRLVIHYHLPPRLESYIQEVGRAGRDGASSVGLILISPNDVYLPKRIIETELPSVEDIGIIFQQLRSLFQDGGKLPENETLMENMLQLTEVQWRFLSYQLEQHGILNSGKIIGDKNKWETAYHSISNLINDRIKLKKNKLNEIVQWVFEKECLRVNLYKGFQASYSTPLFKCCSNCGFSFSKWKPAETKQTAKESLSWESKLKKLLLIGEAYETK